MLALPVDPLTSLATKLKLQDLKDYQETWKTTSESVQLLKDTMFTGGKPITRRLFEDNVPGNVRFLHHIPLVFELTSLRLLYPKGKLSLLVRYHQLSSVEQRVGALRSPERKTYAQIRNANPCAA